MNELDKIQIRKTVIEHRLNTLESQVIDTEVNIEIYSSLTKQFGSEMDKRQLAAEQEKLIRYNLAKSVALRLYDETLANEKAELATDNPVPNEQTYISGITEAGNRDAAFIFFNAHKDEIFKITGLTKTLMDSIDAMYPPEEQPREEPTEV